MKLPLLPDEWKERFARVRSNEGLLAAIAISAIIIGIGVDFFLLRLICLAVILVSGAFFVNIRFLQGRGTHPSHHGSSRFSTSTQFQHMKKLIFDDFQFSERDNDSSSSHLDDSENVQSHEEQLPSKNIDDIINDRHEVPLNPVRPRQPLEHRVPAPLQPVMYEFQIADFFDCDSEIFKSESEPRTEFDFLLGKVLGVIKEVLFAHTVAFFWANREKQQMVLETKMTDCTQFLSSRRFAMGHDLLSKVAHTGKPEFVTEVNPTSEQELIRYYDSPQAIKSFIGVPVFFTRGTIDPTNAQPVAVIAVDSKAGDDFGPETLSLLGKFTKLISALIKSYNDKYDLLLDSELLNSIRRLQDRVRNAFSLDTIIQALSEETSKLINWDYLTITLYDEAKHAWVVKKVVNRSHSAYIITNQVIDFPESIAGQTIRSNVHRLIDEITADSLPRFCLSEKLESQGSFLSVPISSLNKCYGAISLESREKFNFSRRDVDMLYRLSEHCASALEIFYLQEMIHEYVIVDDVTGLYSKKFFIQRLQEELQRADDGNIDASMLLITIDKMSEILQRFGSDGVERIIVTLAKAIRNSIRPYDLVGRFDDNRFAILLMDTASNDAYLWAEKIRKSIAGLVINIDGKSFSITISVGVCGALEGMAKEELLSHTVTVLNRATEAGGNTVRVF